MITPTNDDGGLINQQFSMNVLIRRMGPMTTSSSDPASPPNGAIESMLIARSRARGSTVENKDAMRGRSTTWFASDRAMVKLHVVIAGLNAPP